MFILMSQLFAFFSCLIFLYLLTVYLIHSIWEKVTLYNRGFSLLRCVCNKYKLLRKYLLNKWHTFFIHTIYYHKNSKVAKISLSVSPLHIDVISDLHIYQRSVAWMLIQYISIWIPLKSMKIEEWWFNIFPFEFFWIAEI